jgi:hypothetical protein
LLYYLPATPTVDIRNRVVARSFDPGDGSVGTQPIDVLALSEMIVPAMISSRRAHRRGRSNRFSAGELPR